MKSLRGQLAVFWVILSTVSIGLAIVMLALFRSSAGAQIEQVRSQAEQACSMIATRYARSIEDGPGESPRIDLLQVLLQLVLIETPRVEGGVWSERDGFVAYAYPTYEGSGVKRDVPQAEQPHIAEVARVAARTRQPQTDVVRASREALVVCACPLQPAGAHAVGWTMARAPAGSLDAQQSLRAGLGVLMVFVLASGAWLGAILLRGYRHVRRLEREIANDDARAAPAALAPTGVAELDRIVGALNGYRGRLDEARARLRDVERQRARDQRLAALGRMTGSVAHEIRNPIAAMRLKAENALAGPAERQPDALRVILGQVGRLDELVRSLLAIVQPVQLRPQSVEVNEWLQARVAAARHAADARPVRIECGPVALGRACFDPTHLGRAVDNLLDNAARHARSRVAVSMAHDEAARLWIRIDDDGPGVPQALREQLFEPFASGRPDGTGLGLALAREVAFAHGGELRHVPLADGTRFELELPWRDC